jgi:outer membrane PBP1 activator LpoA protein
LNLSKYALLPPVLVAIVFFPSCGVKKKPVNEAVAPKHKIEYYLQKAKNSQEEQTNE